MSDHRSSWVSRCLLWMVVTLTGSLFSGSSLSTAGVQGRFTAVQSAVMVWEVVVEPEAPGDVGIGLTGNDGLVVAHLAPYRWLVSGDRSIFDGVAGIRSIRIWNPADGVHGELRAVAASEKMVVDADILIVAVFAPGSVMARLEAKLKAEGVGPSWVETSAAGMPQMGFRVPASRVPSLLETLEQTPGMILAEPQAPVRLLNSDSVWLCQSGLRDRTPVFDRGLHGEGQIIGIMDTGIDIDECRFDDPVVGWPALNRADGIEVNLDHRKVLAVDFHWDEDWPPLSGSWDDQGHGTHVAGSAAGDVNANGIYDGVDGMAPAARLVIQDGGAWVDDCADLPGLGCPVKPLGPVLEQARDQGARIHTNSWGDEENTLPFGRYTERTSDVDRFMWEHKDTLVFFAAGNSGPALETVISPSIGKNVVSVGATLHGDFDPPCTVSFSSRGPTLDGRIKPDVVAPGMWVVSAATNNLVPGPSCSNTTKSGTSMAAPTAAGLGALVRQYFVDGYHPTGTAVSDDSFEPTGALVKAVLIASAVDLSTKGCSDEPIPSPDQGWGLIRLDTALAFEGGTHKLLVDDQIGGFGSATDDAVSLDIAVTQPGPLKIVLVWTDAPSSSLAVTHLLNDLDLVVRGPNGVYTGNSFSAGVSVSSGDADRLNNVEVVFLPEAAKGIWTIEVSPHAIPVPDQDFALVVTGPVRPEEGPRRPSGRVAP